MPKNWSAMHASHPYAGIVANLPVKTVDDAVIDSFESALHFLRSAPSGSRDSRLVASNVMVSVRCFDEQMREPVEIDVVLYDTPIVRYYSDGTFSVDNGGFNTPTTRTRVVQFTPRGFAPYHRNKKLWCNGGECTHDRRFTIPKETA